MPLPMCPLVEGWKHTFQCFDVINSIIQIHVLMNKVQIMRFHQNMVMVKVFRLSLTPTQSGCQARLHKFCPIKVIYLLHQMDMSSGEMNFTLQSDDKVPNQWLCLNHLIYLNPTISCQGKNSKLSNCLISLTQVSEENSVCPVRLATMISIDV